LARDVLHVFPADLRRGAQTRGRMICDLLDRPDERHQVLTLFAAPAQTDGVLRPDLALDIARRGIPLARLDPRAVIGLRRAIRAERPSVVVAHGGESLKYAALACPRGTPLVYDKIGVAPERRAAIATKMRANSLLARRAALVVCVSEDVRREATEVWGYQRDRCIVIPNGRDPSAYSPPEGGRASDNEAILFVGTLVASKRPEWFVQLIARLRREGMPITARMVGDGPLRSTLCAAADDAAIELLGERTDVAELMRSSGLFVFTSVEAGEGMPGVLIEAGLSALPVVATTVPGAASVVRDGVTGVLVGVDDFVGLVTATRRLLLDADLRTTMGAAARAHCVEHHSNDVIARRWKQALDGIRSTSGLS
jgi:glycosyltransferase involved in cell wall biosynthesis